MGRRVGERERGRDARGGGVGRRVGGVVGVAEEAEEAEETDTPSDELEVELGAEEEDDVELGWDRARPLISSSYCLQDKSVLTFQVSSRGRE